MVTSEKPASARHNPAANPPMPAPTTATRTGATLAMIAHGVLEPRPPGLLATGRRTPQSLTIPPGAVFQAHDAYEVSTLESLLPILPVVGLIFRCASSCSAVRAVTVSLASKASSQDGRGVRWAPQRQSR